MLSIETDKRAFSCFILFVVLSITTISAKLSSWVGPEVAISFGKIKGKWENSMEGKRYSSFEGVPYAKPPVGNLRFEKPIPIGPWRGTWPAINRFWCAQINTSIDGTGTIIGHEDCLYLNVYVPGEKINRSNHYDVLVDIHGGAFMMGSATLINNPPYIMDNMDDMILVAINYRVGPFGFLSTEDNVIPGNNGMKDQVLALKWVRKNIRYFGGNPESVTILGFSAGAASVHLHILSPMSRGLFHKAHCGSGSAFSPSVIKEKPLEFAKKLASLAGCPTEPSQLLKQCLKTRSTNVLLRVHRRFYGYGQRMPFSPFAVVVEKNSTNPFLAKLPYELVREGRIANVPVIFSIVKDEGLYPSACYCENPEEIEKVWTDKAHHLLDYNYTLPLEERKDVAKKVKDFYMGQGTKIGKSTFSNFTKIFSDRHFVDGSEVAAKLHSVASNSPVYVYYFNYQSPNISSSAVYCAKGDIGGIAHAADAINCLGFNLTKYLSKSDKEMKERCHQMYSSFAKTGVPAFVNKIWKPTSGVNLIYLNISGPNDMKMEESKSLCHSDFWREFGLAENEKDVFF